MVSVIVPVYNGRKYIYNCMEKLCQQTYKNIEIIGVDDGSTDETARIIAVFAANDSRVKYVWQENGGPSEARNKGISISTGEYTAFVDADDFVSENYVETLLEMMKNFLNQEQK